MSWFSSGTAEWVKIDGLLGVDAAGKVVDDHVVHVVADVLGGVAVRDHLVVSNDDVGVDA